MRRILPFLMLLGVAACGLPQTRWEKPGVDEKATAADLVACRHAASQEAFATYPFPYGSPFFGYRRFGSFGYYEENRFYAESRLANFCMRNKGYELVTVKPPQTTAPAPEK
ncbi:MAG: hypothetical protein JSR24_08720 [Proteobacteria bacterium]|nr:hypothetical protein [Pseudomonadota bacterium]